VALGDKSYWAPFETLKNIFKKPQTVAYPQEDIDVFAEPGVSPNYRGMHANDLDKCIGCGTCSDICPYDAIDMQDLAEKDKGKTTLRPVIDYGRCSFCAFCVDSCPSGSLTMTKEYIHEVPAPKTMNLKKEILETRGSFKIQPTGEFLDKAGFYPTVESSWLSYQRTKMGSLNVPERQDSFIEIIKGYSQDQAKKEADRCLECGICMENCPATMDIPNYIKAIREDDLERALEILYDTNPFPAACGRICTHNCETICALSHRGEAIAIRWLKRYIVDALPALKYQELIKQIDNSGKKVAIIGGGPGGLAAAYYLRSMGHQITVYDTMAKAGGVLRYGIPAYRLPDDALDADIKFIESLGVEIKTNQRVGVTLDFQKDIAGKNDVVLLATGFYDGRSTHIEGGDHRDVFRAMKLLRKISAGKDVPVEKKIVVIGGGNVAMDIARSLARLQRQKYGKVDISLTCLECKIDMTCDAEELDEATEEGINVMNEWAPTKVNIKNDKVVGLSLNRCLSIFDDNGSFNPKIDQAEDIFVEGAMVVEAIGQAANFRYLPESLQKKLQIERGRIPVNKTKQTKVKSIFAAGDITKGPDAITAINEGHEAAKGIDSYLRKLK